MQELQFIEIKIDFPTAALLTVCDKNDDPNLYKCEFRPSEQILSFQPQFGRQETTSIGPMYSQSGAGLRTSLTRFHQELSIQ